MRDSVFWSTSDLVAIPKPSRSFQVAQRLDGSSGRLAFSNINPPRVCQTSQVSIGREIISIDFY